MHPFTRIFMAIWFGGLGVFTLLVIISLLFGDRQPQQPIHIFLEGPLIMALFGTALIRFGWWIAKGQRQSMRDFIRNDLLAQPQTQS
jgi:Na+/citrate or Na+/malate symporter